MTISEAHTEFKFRCDKLDALNYPNFLPEEIDLILNNAYQRYIKQRYGINNVKRSSFEETQKRTEDLKNLVLTTNISAQPYDATNNISTNSRFFLLPADHWFTIQERITLIDTCGNTVNAEVRPIQHLEFDKVVNDAFKRPDNTKVLRLMDNGKVELTFAPNTSIFNYKLRYIKQPVTVNINTGVTFETSDHTHSEIIDEAVKIALESIEGKRTNTFTPIVDNTKE